MKTKLQDSSSQLESFVVKQLLKSSGAFKGSDAAGSSLVNDLFADTLADAVAAGGGIGLAHTISASMEPAPRAHVSSGFGQRTDPLTGKPQFHGGVDLPAPEGTPIPAAQDGVVLSARQRAGYGLAIELQHADGTTTLYAHASRLDVEPGQHVSAGQTIAHVGQTGRTTGPHLHFELRQRGAPVDPRHALKTYSLRAEQDGGELP